MDALKVESLVVGYGSNLVLRGLSLHIAEGRSLALLGPNGAGKSTFVLAVAGLLRPRSGSISSYGNPVDHLSAAKRARLGLVSVTQERDLFSELTVLDNLSLGQRCRGERDGWTPADVFELFPSLYKKSTTRAEELSGGQQQMLAIGRALVACPRVLVLDEPSAGLSEDVLSDVARSLEVLRSEGQAILLVEQRLDMALDLCDDYVVLSRGEKVLEDRVANTDLTKLQSEYFGS